MREGEGGVGEREGGGDERVGETNRLREKERNRCLPHSLAHVLFWEYMYNLISVIKDLVLPSDLIIFSGCESC